MEPELDHEPMQVMFCHHFDYLFFKEASLLTYLKITISSQQDFNYLCPLL